MTVKELKEKLNQFPDNMDVFVCERKTEFSFGLVNGVYKHGIRFSEDTDDVPDDAPLVDCVVIDEE